MNSQQRHCEARERDRLFAYLDASFPHDHVRAWRFIREQGALKRFSWSQSKIRQLQNYYRMHLISEANAVSHNAQTKS